MGTTTISVTLDDTTRQRIKQAALQLDRTPNWLMKQAIVHYLNFLEKDKKSTQPLPDVNIITEDENNRDHPFRNLADEILPQSITRSAITAAYDKSEHEVVPYLLKEAQYTEKMAESIKILAKKLSYPLRYKKYQYKGRRSEIVQDLLQEFSLSSQEGIALMCLAESLLRIPDKSTRDALIRDKINNRDWKKHLGKSRSIFVNAVTWGLLLTGKLVKTINYNEISLSCSLKRIIDKNSTYLIHKAVDMAMRLIGQQFVIGEDISEALSKSCRLEKQGFRYSYDMLGEAALTDEDAKAYLLSYEQAIHAIGKASNGLGIYQGPGISVKLSALHPRYCRSQYKRVMAELYPRLLRLTLLARQYDIGLNIDAEEANRLEISLDLFTKLCFEPEIAGWNGIGFVIQAYQKRCSQIIDEIIYLATRSHRRIMIRLVKGAYWDSEIKHAQIEGFKDYPVFTRKVYTDLAYLSCARKLLSVPQYIYPQFATHNAHSLSAIYYLAGENYYPGQYEFQCLHGMSEALYDQVVGKISDGKLNRPCRIYAPVGTHETLFSYLVRRLLENGANTSFIHQISDSTISIEQIVTDPLQEVISLGEREERLGLSHPQIPLPRNIYGLERNNTKGIDLSNEHNLAALSNDLINDQHRVWRAAPIIVGTASNTKEHPIYNPADNCDVVGTLRPATHTDITQALTSADYYSAIWSEKLPYERSEVLKKAANLFENAMTTFIGLLVREAGKTFSNAVAEVREAVDFLRYYACQIAYNFPNDNSYRPLGLVVCISPWNFPLAIFTGQIAAALAAGNTVLAKPSEQTPLIATIAVSLMLESGVPAGVLQLLPGEGATIGSALIADPRVCGVMFTGSIQVARRLQNILAKRLDSKDRPIPFIAETGGLNAMLVDSSALTEQVVSDVLVSAFDSAGQRCSALRLLCIQEDVFDKTLCMLRGAMSEYKQGNPKYLSTDVGPVINASAKKTIDQYIIALRDRGHTVWNTDIINADDSVKGHFIPLTLIELNSIEELTEEIFGPILHIVRYRRNELDIVIDEINSRGYGLTFGLHTRIDETINHVIEKINVGNCYINRNIVGAVVGVQPFGGEGLSGTGPKAGGPLYLYRLLSERPDNSLLPAFQMLDTMQKPNFIRKEALQTAHSSFVSWIKIHHPNMASCCQNLGDISQAGSVRQLIGPTGEKNSYLLLPRRHILCLADQESDLLIQLAAVTSIGSKAIWTSSSQCSRLLSELPKSVQKCITLLVDWKNNNITLDAVLFHGNSDNLHSLLQTLALRPGPLIGVQSYRYGDTHIVLERLLLERVISINTTASGGNTTLINMT